MIEDIEVGFFTALFVILIAFGIHKVKPTAQIL